MYPNLGVMDDSPGKLARPKWHDGSAEFSIHSSSINHALDAHHFSRPYLVFLEKVCFLWYMERDKIEHIWLGRQSCNLFLPPQYLDLELSQCAKVEGSLFRLLTLLQVRTHRIYVMDCTMVSPVTLMLFGGDLRVQYDEGHVLVDDWIRIRVAAPTAALVKLLRQSLDTLLRQKIHHPEMDVSLGSTAIIDALCRLLKDEEIAQQWKMWSSNALFASRLYTIPFRVCMHIKHWLNL